MNLAVLSQEITTRRAELLQESCLSEASLLWREVDAGQMRPLLQETRTGEEIAASVVCIFQSALRFSCSLGSAHSALTAQGDRLRHSSILQLFYIPC